MTFLRTIWVWTTVLAVTIALSSFVVIAAMLRLDEKWYDQIAHTWGRWIIKLSGVHVDVEGLENIRMDEPQIFASNHVSWYDVFALAAFIPKRYRFVAKAELGKIPIFGRAWQQAGHVSVNRQDRTQAIKALEEFGRVIREDKSSIVIFPEGTRSHTNEMLPFKKGAFMLALHTHVDIIPVGISGSRDVMRKGDWRVRDGRIIVRFGEPIPTAGYNERNREELVALVRSRIQDLLATPTAKTK